MENTNKSLDILNNFKFDTYIPADKRGVNFIFTGIDSLGSYPLLIFVGLHFYYVNMVPVNVSTTLGKSGLTVVQFSGDPNVHNIETIKENGCFRLKVYLNNKENGNNVSLLKIRQEGVLKIQII